MEKEDSNLTTEHSAEELQPKPDEKVEVLSTRQKRIRDIQKTKGKSSKIKKSHWAIKATVITLFLSALFTFVAEMTKETSIVVTLILLIFLILGSIIFDGIGVAVAACELAPLTAMASKKVKGSKMAIKLVNNAEVVSSICNDVIGDIFGILSGACTVVVAAAVTTTVSTVWAKVLTIFISALVSALIVGGKAFLKNYAIYKSKELVMMTARVMSLFSRDECKKKKK